MWRKILKTGRLCLDKEIHKEEEREETNQRNEERKNRRKSTKTKMMPAISRAKMWKREREKEEIL